MKKNCCQDLVVRLMRFSSRSRILGQKALSDVLATSTTNHLSLQSSTLAVRRQAGGQWQPSPGPSPAQGDGCASEKCSRPPGQARGSQTPVGRNVVFSKSRSAGTRLTLQPSLLRKTFPHYPCWEVKASDQCALCFGHASPSA